MAGLFASAALAGRGWTVRVLDRDPLSVDPQHRRGVPQDRQAHILLHRGMVAIEQLLPGFRRELLARDAVPFDTGTMPWLGEYGWLATGHRGLGDRVGDQAPDGCGDQGTGPDVPGGHVRPETRVTALRAGADGWLVSTEPTEPGDGTSETLAADSWWTPRVAAPGSTKWLPDLAESGVEEVDARVGYAGRLYQQGGPLPVRSGVMVFGRAEDGASGLALPVEGGQWMISATGLGDQRPPREPADFEHFLAALRDPAIKDLVGCLEPVSDVAVHRQTANRRHGWGLRAGWPTGLLVVGDALCSLNPVYGQGITVAALQAEAITGWLAAGRAIDHRSSAGCGRSPTCPGPSRPATTSGSRPRTSAAVEQRLAARLTDRMARLAAAGNVRATRAFSDVYHLMASPTAFLHPALLLAAARPLPRTRLPRPAVLDELSRSLRERPPAAPADA